MNPALFFGFFSRRQLVTETFTTSQTWVAPSTTSFLISLVGEGKDGTPATWSTLDIELATTRSVATASGGVTVSKAEMVSYAQSVASAFSLSTGERTVSYDIVIGRTGTDNLTQLSIASGNGTFRGSGTFISRGGSGNVTNANADSDYGGDIRIDFKTSNGTTGSSTTGFGKTFPGGVKTTATPFTYNNVAVAPSTGYPLVIPSGGSITITYYA